jgi:hypothetical protein
MSLMGRHLSSTGKAATIKPEDFAPYIPALDGQILSYSVRAQSGHPHLEWVDHWPIGGTWGDALLSDGRGGVVWGGDPYKVTLQEIDAYANSTINVPYGYPADVTITPYKHGIDLDLAFDFVIPYGPQGETGEQGPYSTVDAGSAWSVPYFDAPYVVNDGTPYDAVFSFGIPQGVPGDSAYKVWYDVYGGTQAEYFEFLKGEQGNDGHDSEVSVAGTYSTPYGTSANVVDLAASDPYKVELEFYIPYGGQGEQGDKGDRGETGLSAFQQWQVEQGNCFNPYDPSRPGLEQPENLDEFLPYCSFQDFLEATGGGSLNDWSDGISTDPNNLIELGSDNLLLVDGTNVAKLDEENVFTEPNNFQEKLSVGPDETFFVEVRSTSTNPFALDTDRIKDFTLTPDFTSVEAQWGHESFSYDSVAMYDKDVDGVQGKELANVDYVDEAVSDATGNIDFTPYATTVYVDDGDAQTLQDANDYTDQAIDAIPDINFDPYATTDYVDAGDADTLAAANKHSDDNDVLTKEWAKNYTDGEVAKKVDIKGDTMTGKLNIEMGPDIDSNRNSFTLMGNISDGAGGVTHGILLKDYRRQTPTTQSDYIQYYGSTNGDYGIMNRKYADTRYGSKVDIENLEKEDESLQQQIDQLKDNTDKGNWKFIGLSYSPGIGEVAAANIDSTGWVNARDFRINKTDIDLNQYNFHKVQAGSLVRIQVLDPDDYSVINTIFYEVTTFNNSDSRYFVFDATYISHSGYGMGDVGDIWHLTILPSGSIDDSGYAKLDRTNTFTAGQKINIASGDAIQIQKAGTTGVKLWANGTIEQQDLSVQTNSADGMLVNRKNLKDHVANEISNIDDSNYAKLNVANSFTHSQTITRGASEELIIGKQGNTINLKIWSDGSIAQVSMRDNTANNNFITRKNANDGYGRLANANTWTNAQTVNRSGNELWIGKKSNVEKIKIWADGSVQQIDVLANTNDNHLVNRKNLKDAIDDIPKSVPYFKQQGSSWKMKCHSSTSSHSSSSLYFVPLTTTGNNSWQIYVNNTHSFAFFVNDDWFSKELTGQGLIIIRQGINAIYTGAIHNKGSDRTVNGHKYQQFQTRALNSLSGSWTDGAEYEVWFSGTHWA